MRRHLPLVLAVLLVPLAASLSGRSLETFIAPAAACTGTPRFDPGAIVILPADGATVPRNAQVLFFANVEATLFEKRPTEPAEVRIEGKVLPLSARSSEGLGLPHLEANTTYELWLPDDLAPPWGKAPPKLTRARSFTTTSEDDTTPPRIRLVGAPTFHRFPPSSCGPAPRIELPVDVEDASPTFIELSAFVEGRPDDRTTKLVQAPIVSGRIVVLDPVFAHVDGPETYATHLVLTPVDIAGNRGAAKTVELRRLADGGPEPPATPTSVSPGTGSRVGCGK